MPTETELRGQLDRLAGVLEQRGRVHDVVARYDDGSCPLPAAITSARVTKAYRMLMPLAEAPWGSLVVDSVQDRLEVAGVRSSDPAADDTVWAVWQSLGMDSESKLAHRSALLDGRAFALVWEQDGRPTVSLDDATQMAVMYREGSRRDRVAALRKWVDDGTGDKYATLYRPDGIYKFVFNGTRRQDASEVGWQRRDVPGEPWPVPNPVGEVPVVELPVNQRLKPGSFGYARGEFQHCTGLIDRINLLTFLGLVVAFWQGFPLRAVIGERILYDDDGNPMPPFEVNADSLAQLENPEAKLAEFGAADRRNLSVFAELDQLAVVTKTPRHYFPLEQGMSNLSADAIMASEGGLHAKVTGHKASLGEGWEAVLRLAGRFAETEVELPPDAELVWKDHESRSLAERADAAVKVKDLLPWQAVAERFLNATDAEIARWESQRSSDAFGQLVAAAAAPAPTGPALNGGGENGVPGG